MIVPCLQVDRQTRIHIPRLAYDVRPISYRGVRPYISNGTITFNNEGTIYNIKLDNGSIYTFQERDGTIIFDISTNGRHGWYEGATRTITETDEPNALWEITEGHNNYFIGDGSGFRVQSLPLKNSFTAAFLLASIRGTEIAIDFQGAESRGTISLGNTAKWITIRKQNDDWAVFQDGNQLISANQSVGDIEGDIDALIGGADMPIATRRFLLWTRALPNTEIPSASTTIPDNPTIHYHASASIKNPVKNLANENYNGQGNPIIANVGAIRSQSKDTLGQPCIILNLSNIPQIRSIASYNDYRKPLLIDNIQQGQTQKYLYLGRNFYLNRKGRHIARVLEIVK